MKTLFLCALALPAFGPTMPADPCALAIHRVGLAITAVEGVRASLNNPGAIVDRRGIPVRFQTLADGRNAMTKMLHARKHLTVRRLVKVWTGHDAPEYARFIAKRARLRLDERICK